MPLSGGAIEQSWCFDAAHTRLCVERSSAGGDGFGTQVAKPVVYNLANGLIQSGPPEQQSNPHTKQWVDC